MCPNLLCCVGPEVQEGEILKELPVHLRAKLVCHVLRDVFQNSYIFKVGSAISKAS